jgi:Arc/MetJ family transcription regulator
MMRTNIVLNDQLVKEAFKFTAVSTKRELIELALKEFVENHKRKNVSEIRGKVKLCDDYDYKKLREDKK